MNHYKHIQIGYPIIIATSILFAFFIWIQLTARSEPSSIDSGTNFLFTGIMTLITLVLFSFSTLTVTIDQKNLTIKFGFGVFRKKFKIEDISSINKVRNPWYLGCGIRFLPWPKMWIYNVSGYDAVELKMKNGNIYRIGTDETDELESELKRATWVKYP